MNYKEKLWRAFFHGSALAHWITIQQLTKSRKKNDPTHILFCMADHFEPGTGYVDLNIEKERMKTLLSKYPPLSERHRDFYGNPLKRTWFFPPHYHRNSNLKELVSLCESGYGEIELHLHHGKTRPDTSENLKNTLIQCVEEYSRFGIFGSENNKKKYGFIHGDYALDNSLNGKYCGVNNEIKILEETGCYADFTFPSLNVSNPLMVNSIFYATDNPTKPKSHNWGVRVRKNSTKKGDLMIIPGVLYPSIKVDKALSIRMNWDNINGRPPKSKKDIDLWIKTNIHVKGKQNWIFVKTHTHGAIDNEAILGREMDQICEYLETKYNDNKKFTLHYVTARELYNIIKAIEAGESGSNPEAYRDYKIDRPLYDSSSNITEASGRLQRLIAKTYR